MSLSVASLLLHDDDVPAAVRAALRDAYAAPEEQRTPLLELAARALYREAELECDDARELVGLPDGVCG
jgi:hypothetical protein